MKIAAGRLQPEARSWKLERGNWKTTISSLPFPVSIFQFPVSSFQLLSSSLRLLVSVSFFIFFIGLPAYAEVRKAGVENIHTLRANVHIAENNFYLTRIQGYVDWGFKGVEQPLRIAPFWEYQSNLTTNTWWRKEAGIEIGREFFNDCFYTGASFQHVWQKEENYPVELLDETTEWESRFVITPPIKWGLFKDKLKLRFFDEYTFDFSRGQYTINEVGITLEWVVGENLRIPAGWRHVDRVHDYDNDMMDVSLVFCF